VSAPAWRNGARQGVRVAETTHAEAGRALQPRHVTSVLQPSGLTARQRSLWAAGPEGARVGARASRRPPVARAAQLSAMTFPPEEGGLSQDCAGEVTGDVTSNSS